MNAQASLHDMDLITSFEAVAFVSAKISVFSGSFSIKSTSFGRFI